MTNRTSGVLVTTVVIVLAGILSMSAIAQQKPAPPKTHWAATDLLPLTCAQAWAKADKTYSKMLSIVVTLARVSLANRDLTFPDTREAGLETGKRIAEDCKADPNGLLFAIVDKHVRQVAEAATSARLVIMSMGTKHGHSG
jgi:hypothetical protein